MRLELREHKGYDDGAVVHHVTEVVGHLRNGPYHHYPVACGVEHWGQHLSYVDTPTTCIPCLVAHRPGHLKCRRTACNRVLPIESMWIHTQSGEQYCAQCAHRINEHNPDLVVIQS